MTDIFKDPILHYKNFKMGTEIEIAGTFIYNGMKELEQINIFDIESEMFMFLYNLAVGIERLQKVTIVLSENIEDITVFEDSLKSHNHQDLHNRILRNDIDIRLSSRENAFLQLLSRFYDKHRYGRFHVSTNLNAEKLELSSYIKQHYTGVYENDFFTGSIRNNEELKDFFGRVIGSIAKKYYLAIERLARLQNIYTYEIRGESKAEKVFLQEFRKNSLQEQNINEKIAAKELIVYLMQTNDRNPFFRYIDSIEPLDFDIALANEYLEQIIGGNISQDLVSTVEYEYVENGYSLERVRQLDVIGNRNVDFEFAQIQKCKALLKCFLNAEIDCYTFANDFLDEMSYLDNIYGNSILKEMSVLCQNFIKQLENGLDMSKQLKNQFLEIYEEFKEFYCLHEFQDEDSKEII
ncbi:hypothetical protein [Solibacillus sp. FSL K6-1554]|uniref:hypothetical protein n=1 Tax=Solibacillus sp. FSL K6-1554 TaxID=2921472 RepID=UPI0030F67FFB